MNERTKELAEQCGYRSNPDIYDRNQSFDIEKFAELVQADEREACAKVCEGWEPPPDHLRGGTKKVVPSDYSNSHQPVAFRNINTGEFCTGGFLRKDWAKWQPLYTAPVTCQENRQVAPPPQREWVWLSDQDYEEIMKEKTYWYEVPKAVEIKSKEKNT
jgi:hypothetical protein